MQRRNPISKRGGVLFFQNHEPEKWTAKKIGLTLLHSLKLMLLSKVHFSRLRKRDGIKYYVQEIKR